MPVLLNSLLLSPAAGGADPLTFAGALDGAAPPAPWVTSAGGAGAAVDVLTERMRLISGAVAGAYHAARALYDALGALTDFDRVVEVDFANPLVEQYVNIGVRVDAFTTTGDVPVNGYAVSLRPGTNQVAVIKSVDGTPTVHATGTYNFVAGTKVNAWVQIAGSTPTIKAWVWNAGTANPTEATPTTVQWAETTSPVTSGKWGVAMASGLATKTAYIDNVLLEPPPPAAGPDYLSFSGFADGAAPPSPWVVIPPTGAGSSVTVQLERLAFTAGPGDVAGRAVMSGGAFSGLTDFDRVVTLTPEDQYANFGLRIDTFTGNDNYPTNGYAVSIRVGSGLEKVVIAKVNGRSWAQKAAGNFTYTPGTSIKVWTKITGGATTVIKVWVWREGDPAPADTVTPTATWTDTSSTFLSGLWGFGASPFTAYLDDIELAAPSPGGTGGGGGGGVPPSQSGPVVWTPSTIGWGPDTVEWS